MLSLGVVPDPHPNTDPQPHPGPNLAQAVCEAMEVSEGELQKLLPTPTPASITFDHFVAAFGSKVMALLNPGPALT